MPERVTLTRQANNGQAMTVQEVCEVAGAWLLAGVPAGTVPVARTSGTGLWALSVTYDRQQPVTCPDCGGPWHDGDQLDEQEAPRG